MSLLTLSVLPSCFALCALSRLGVWRAQRLGAVRTRLDAAREGYILEARARVDVGVARTQSDAMAVGARVR